MRRMKVTNLARIGFALPQDNGEPDHEDPYWKRDVFREVDGCPASEESIRRDGPDSDVAIQNDECAPECRLRLYCVLPASVFHVEAAAKGGRLLCSCQYGSRRFHDEVTARQPFPVHRMARALNSQYALLTPPGCVDPGHDSAIVQDCTVPGEPAFRYQFQHGLTAISVSGWLWRARGNRPASPRYLCNRAEAPTNRPAGTPVPCRWAR
jgi:hypothetical protein